MADSTISPPGGHGPGRSCNDCPEHSIACRTKVSVGVAPAPVGADHPESLVLAEGPRAGAAVDAVALGGERLQLGVPVQQP